MNVWTITFICVILAIVTFACWHLKITHLIRILLIVLCVSGIVLLLMYDRFAGYENNSEEVVEIGTYELSPFYDNGEKYFLEETDGELYFSYIEREDSDNFLVVQLKTDYDPGDIAYNPGGKPVVIIEDMKMAYRKKWLFLEGPSATEQKTMYIFVVEGEDQIYHH